MHHIAERLELGTRILGAAGGSLLHCQRAAGRLMCYAEILASLRDSTGSTESGAECHDY